MSKFKVILFSILICYSKIVETVPFSDEPYGHRAIQPSDWLLRQNAHESNRNFVQTHEGSSAVKPATYYENRGGQYDTNDYNGNQPSLPNNEYPTLNSMADLHKLVNYGRPIVPTDIGSEYRDRRHYQKLNDLSQNQNIASNSYGGVITDQERAILHRSVENYDINNFPHEKIQEKYNSHYYQPKNEYLIQREHYKPIPENSRYVQPMPVNFQNPRHLTTYENPEAAQKSNIIRNLPHLPIISKPGVSHNPDDAFRIQHLPLKSLPMYSVSRNNVNTAQVTAEQVLEEDQGIATNPNTFLTVPRLQQIHENPNVAKVSEHNVIASNPVLSRDDGIFPLSNNYNTNNNIPVQDSQPLQEAFINNADSPKIHYRSNNFNKNNGDSVRITDKLLDESERDLEYAEDLLTHTKEVKPSYIYPEHEVPLHINDDNFGNNDALADSEINQQPTDELNTDQDIYHHQLSLKDLGNLKPENIMSDPQIKDILSKKKANYVILYANGTVGYADDLESFKHTKNYIMINGGKIVSPPESNDDVGNSVPTTADSSTVASISVENIDSSTIAPPQNSFLEITYSPLATSIEATSAPLVTTEDEIVTISPIEPVTDTPSTKKDHNKIDKIWEDQSTLITQNPSKATKPSPSIGTTPAPVVTTEDEIITISPIEQATDNVSDIPLTSSPTTKDDDNDKNTIWTDPSTPKTHNPIHIKALSTTTMQTSSKDITPEPATSTDDQVITLSPIEQSTDNVSDGPLKPSPTSDHYHKNDGEIWKDKSAPITQNPVHNKPSSSARPITSKHITLAPATSTDDQIITLSPIEQNTDDVSDGPLKPSPASVHYHDDVWEDNSTPKTQNLVHSEPSSTTTSKHITLTPATTTDDHIIMLSPIEQSTDNVSNGPPKPSPDSDHYHDKDEIWKNKSTPKMTSRPVPSKDISLASAATTDDQIITLLPKEQSRDSGSDSPLKPLPTSENFHKNKDEVWKDKTKPTISNPVNTKPSSTTTIPSSSVSTMPAPIITTDDQIITLSLIEHSTDNVEDDNVSKDNTWNEKSTSKPATISDAKHTTKTPISSLLDRKEHGHNVEIDQVELIIADCNKSKNQSGNQPGQGEDTIILDIITDDNFDISQFVKNNTSSNNPKPSNSPSHTFVHSESSTANTKDLHDHTKSSTPSSNSTSDRIPNSESSRHSQVIKEKIPKISINKNIEIDISNVENKPEVWFRTTDMDFFDKLNSKNDTFDVIYFIQMHNHMIVEKDRKTTIFCNGSALVEVTETYWEYKDDPSPKTIKSSQWIPYENDD